ncbi:circularly permuted type 2 ATP-grasp protein [Aeromicrobium sp. CF4.19]|uniref:circularly permuted type 2 ATP-grasp protein n=1 Tax=Aeromicrobium sp. CF4.19 TaxID=3373082 RepID=UPI003EE67969
MTTLQDYTSRIAQPTLADAEGPFDEVVAADGSLRPAWRSSANALGLGGVELRRARSDIERLLVDDGVVAARAAGAATPWHLDPVPLVLDSAEWSRLDVGLAQRTELMNAVLVDLQGPARLLREGVVPAAVVLGHRGFVRALARPSVADERPLMLGAADLGRTESGEWQVLADRTDAPSGIGYAMENRRVVARVLPAAYRDAGVHAMAPYLQMLRTALMESAPAGGDDPRVVVLTEGSSSPSAYDEAFLASNLGFPLVQGSDLVVAGGLVRLRVHDRLERVDVILRRIGGTASDPLELRGDSRHGVPGLVEAVRRGTVRVVNGLGSGVLENPGLLPFLAQACELLLDEPLRLPSVQTTWLSDPDALQRAGERGDEVVLRSIDGSVDLATLDPGRRWDVVSRRPEGFVAQERPVLSQAPHLESHGLWPRPVRLRTFTTHHGGAYRPLVGGLASVRLDDGRRASKDVWVLKADPGDGDQGLVELSAPAITGAASAAVPRILQTMFALGRHAERAEGLVRLTLAVQGLIGDDRAGPQSPGGRALLVARGAMEEAVPGGEAAGIEEELRSVLVDASRPGSVAHVVAGLRGAAQGVRDQLSADVWRALGVIDRAALLLDGEEEIATTEGAERTLTGLLALHGVTDNMVRDHGWHSLQAGRATERVLQVCQLLRSTVSRSHGDDVDRHVHQMVLLAAESAVTHRRRYRGSVRLSSLLDLLVSDGENPRSVAFNLAAVDSHLAAMPRSTGSTRPERLLADLLLEIERADAEALSMQEDDGGRPHLVRHLDLVIGQVDRLVEAARELHLSSGPAIRAFGLSGVGR